MATTLERINEKLLAAFKEGTAEAVGLTKTVVRDAQRIVTYATDDDPVKAFGVDDRYAVQWFHLSRGRTPESRDAFDRTRWRYRLKLVVVCRDRMAMETIIKVLAGYSELYFEGAMDDDREILTRFWALPADRVDPALYAFTVDYWFLSDRELGEAWTESQCLCGQPRRGYVNPPAQAGMVGQLPLQVTFNGQTQFNIFTQPTGAHWLVVNGIDYRPPAYGLGTVGSNERLIWDGPFALETSDELFFVTT